MAEPAAKKARTEEPVAEEAKVEAKEEDVEHEQDATAVKGAKVSNAAFYVEDTTMNVMQGSNASTLMPLTDGGLQYLLAGAKANVGLTGGRHMFEVKILEAMAPLEDPNSKSRIPQPRSQVRVGFSTSASDPFLGESPDGVCFDSEGQFIHHKTKSKPSQSFTTGDVVAVVLNLEADSPNANTVSLFKDGVRVCKPQALPESLQGQALFPTITFKNLSLHYNFGPQPMVPLPFKCHMVNGASKGAAEEKTSTAPADGVYEVLFPIALPDQGGFQWLDQFLEDNKNYTELSDRAMLKWFEKSGLTRPKGYGPAARTSNDKPEMGMMISALDDLSVRRVLNAVAPIQKRNYVVMEIKSNLTKEERVEMASKWPGFKVVAKVLVGEPPAAFKKSSQALALEAKQMTSDMEHKAKWAQEKSKYMLQKQAWTMEKTKKEQARRMAKMQEKMKKKLEFEQKKKEALAKGEPAPEPEEEKEEEEEEPVEMDEPEPEEPMEVDPPKVELTAEEKKKWFAKGVVGDLTPYILNTSFPNFSLAEKDEGFSEIKYEFADAAKAKAYMKNYIQEMKLTSRIEELTPGEWFATKFKDWQKVSQQWRSKQNQLKAAEMQKVMDATAREMKIKEHEVAKAKAEKEGLEPPADLVLPEEPEEEDKDAQKAAFESLDVFSVEDVNDAGNGLALYHFWEHSDWQMLNLRFEMNLLVHAFRKDANDPDRTQVTTEHLGFYYNKYYKKQLNNKAFGLNTDEELLELIKDTVLILEHKGQKVLESQLPDELEVLHVFPMLTEEHRRERCRRENMGDDSLKLKIINPGNPVGPQIAAAAAAANAATNPAVAALAAVLRPAGPTMPVHPGMQPGMMMQNPMMAAQMAAQQGRPMMPWAPGAVRPQFPQQPGMVRPGMMGQQMGQQRPFMMGQQMGAAAWGGKGW
eukprot:CAMPEP_0197648312 /NCGR_PEP_ID=MMETSP1338-20131121/27677_1 /TAXON_ID=43686 ORGANISM="Pelagodinium beii, Strain RCC1491" /NCGR_SAMPLE_ID=MMETSP1338 /ASSEMBLY_ACC=CAM_ASM_000754 /LENGTH=920 /DNA_ID=CAMNT_0043222289 /DNA_START=44 /DNA_END=2806 /DNA_ORIENTATION=-